MAAEEPVPLEVGVLVCLRREEILGLLSLPALATGERWCKLSCLLNVGASSNDRGREIAGLVFPWATCFEPSVTSFFLRSVRVSKFITYKEELGKWLLADLSTLETGEFHYY